jgi:hypothetical protein
MTEPIPSLYAPRPTAPGPAAPQGMSITALVLGILGIVVGWSMLGAPSIAAIVLGHLALRREPAGRTLARTGLVLGYVGVAVGLIVAMVLLAAVVLPFLWLAASGPSYV